MQHIVFKQVTLPPESGKDTDDKPLLAGRVTYREKRVASEHGKCAATIGRPLIKAMPLVHIR